MIKVIFEDANNNVMFEKPVEDLQRSNLMRIRRNGVLFTIFGIEVDSDNDEIDLPSLELPDRVYFLDEKTGNKRGINVNRLHRTTTEPVGPHGGLTDLIEYEGERFVEDGGETVDGTDSTETTETQ